MTPPRRPWTQMTIRLTFAVDDDGALLLPAEVVPEFADIPCFVGRLPGMAFKTGHRGLGYYRDVRGGPLKVRDGQVL